MTSTVLSEDFGAGVAAGTRRLGARGASSLDGRYTVNTLLPRLARYRDGTSVPPNDALNGGEPEAAAGELGREERVEDAIQRRLVHPDAAVGHAQEDVLPRLERSVQAVQLTGLCVVGAGFERDHARGLAGGIYGVGDEVHHHLTKLGHVGRHARELLEKA